MRIIDPITREVHTVETEAALLVLLWWLDKRGTK